MRNLAVCACALFAAIVVGIAFGREWTDSTGKFKVEADFVALDAGQVTLKKADGSKLRVPLDRLSKADQDEARKLAAQQNPKDAGKTENPFVPLPVAAGSGKIPAGGADAPKPAVIETAKPNSLVKIKRARWGGGQNLGGWDPTDLHKLPVSYGTKDVATPLELAYRPVLPLAASFGKSTAVVFNRETGDAEPDRVKLLDDEQLAGNIQRIYFTPDGRHLLFDTVVNQIHYLVQAELKLTPEELKQIANRAVPPKHAPKSNTA